ncbi:DUF5018 domain-containing protein [Flammeovirga sp. SJP92]|uniref:DUF5018 domain-containing protein n=1 Tax=Flammeovirga sp. SJP92 TaxID=1775430 RepID=UPI000788C7AC|nr:DUF5018 domain-containing protein [Flammeovirga sp. SJP92]KXX71071.1 hypothetical protein AVL50_10745 [Flammeovirga sp. SJP92]
MKLSIKLPLIFLLILLFSCEKDEQLERTSIPSIKEFKFEVTNNNTLSEDIYGVIDSENKTINIQFPANTSLIDLTPTISVAEGINISPNSNVSQDFTAPKVYSLSGEGYVTTEYTVSASTMESDEASIISFRFLASENTHLEDNIIAEIEGETIKVQVSSTVNLTALIPSIEISSGASISPAKDQAMDFTKEVKYMVTSQDGKEKSEYTVMINTLSSEKKITSFDFNIEGTLYEGEIDEDNFEITFSLPNAIDLSNLTPIIEISEKASINPSNNTAQDFTNAVEYEVTAEDGSQQKYTVQINTLSSEKKITSFKFNIEGTMYEGEIDEDNFEITFSLPNTIDLSNLTPIIEISEKATINPSNNSAQDFTNTVNYEVTAEDGSKQEYTVNITILTSLENDRAVLEEFYNANLQYNTLFTYLDWDLEADSMEDWQGVTIKDGRVTRLIISVIYVNEIPKSIGQLSELTSLTIVGTDLKEVPVEICDLEKLEILSLYSNKLTSLPSAIGKLKSLNILQLQENELDALPIEMEQMSSLLSLDVHNNNISELHPGLANIPNLMTLNVKGNPLTSIPQVICDKKNEINNLKIVITKDEEDTCN